MSSLGNGAAAEGKDGVAGVGTPAAAPKHDETSLLAAARGRTVLSGAVLTGPAHAHTGSVQADATDLRAAQPGKTHSRTTQSGATETTTAPSGLTLSTAASRTVASAAVLTAALAEERHGDQPGEEADTWAGTPAAGAHLPVAGTEPHRPTGPAGKARGRGLFGHLQLAQMLWWQVGLVAIGMALHSPTPVMVPLLIGAALLLSLTAIRVQSRWLYQWAEAYAGYLIRPRRRVLPESTDKPLALLTLLSGRTSLRDAEIRGERVALFGNADGVVALLRPRSAEADEPVPAPAALLYAVDDQPVGVITQTVLHTGVRRTERRVCFAVRARRTAEVADDCDVEQVLGNAVRRVLKELDRRNAGSTPLSERDAGAAIAALAHVNAGRGEVTEHWRYWSAGPVFQASFLLAGLDDLASTASDALVRRLLGSAAAVATTVTLTACRPDLGGTAGAVSTEGVLRIAAATRVALEEAVVVLSQLAAAHSIHFERLDGRQRRGVAASLPLGVSLL